MERPLMLATILTLAVRALVAGQEPKTGFMDRTVRIGEVSYAVDAVRQTEVGLGRVLRTQPHNSWDREFPEPELPKWLLGQRRTGRGTR